MSRLSDASSARTDRRRAVPGGDPAGRRTDPSGNSVAQPIRHGDQPAVVPIDRLRLLIGAALGSVLLSYLLVVAAGALVGLTAGAQPSMSALLAAAVPLWLAAHQVPLVVDGAPLGVLPLLPTIAVVALVATWAARVTRRLGGRVREDASAAVATLGGTHASVAVLATALPADPAPATPWNALLGGGLVAAAGAGLGALRVTGPPAWWAGAPSWLRRGLDAACVGAAALASAGALMLLASLLSAADEVHGRLQEAAPGFGAGLGFTMLSLCYLPNALIASVSWLAGPGLSIGTAVSSPLFTSAGPLPPVPLMAAMPVTQPPGWTVVTFALPVLAGVLVGRRCQLTEPDPARRLTAVLVAAAMIAAVFGLLTAIVSGRLAAGPFDPVELPTLAVSAALFALVGVPAGAVVLLPSRRRTRLRSRTIRPAATRADRRQPRRATARPTAARFDGVSAGTSTADPGVSEANPGGQLAAERAGVPEADGAGRLAGDAEVDGADGSVADHDSGGSGAHRSVASREELANGPRDDRADCSET